MLKNPNEIFIRLVNETLADEIRICVFDRLLISEIVRHGTNSILELHILRHSLLSFARKLRRGLTRWLLETDKPVQWE
jgi:hypothetical protein